MRISNENLSIMQQFAHETSVRLFDSQWIEIIRMNKAHGMMLVKQGLLSRQDFEVISRGLDQVANTVSIADLDPKQSDLYSSVMQKLYQAVGKETGERIHLGRSRNDMGCTFRRMAVRKWIREVYVTTLDLIDVLLAHAEQELDTVIPYYTFGQPSQPGTLGHYYLWIALSLSRDLTRLQAAYRNTNQCPMGAAAGIGSSYPLDRQYVSDLLGFDSVMEHTMDCISTPDYLLETESAVAIMMSIISRIAQDFAMWAGSECRILDFDSSIAGSSTIMPQKKNPAAINTIRTKTAHSIAQLSESLSMVRNTTMFPTQEFSREMFFYFDDFMDQANRTLKLVKEVIGHTSVNREIAYRYAQDGFTGASAMAEYLAQQYGLPFTQTHHVAAGMIRKLMEKGQVEVKYLTGALLAEVSEQLFGTPILLSDEEVQKMLEPVACMENMVTGGGPRASDCKKMLEDFAKCSKAHRAWLERADQRICKAYSRLQNFDAE